MNIREAILKAADHIQSNPGAYQFITFEVPNPGCPACMVGWIGHFLGMPAGTINNKVKEVVGRPLLTSYTVFRDLSGSYKFQSSAEHAAQALRLYADKYHPAEVKASHQQIGDWSAIAHIWRPRQATVAEVWADIDRKVKALRWTS